MVVVVDLPPKFEKHTQHTPSPSENRTNLTNTWKNGRNNKGIIASMYHGRHWFFPLSPSPHIFFFLFVFCRPPSHTAKSAEYETMIVAIMLLLFYCGVHSMRWVFFFCCTTQRTRRTKQIFINGEKFYYVCRVKNDQWWHCFLQCELQSVEKENLYRCAFFSFFLSKLKFCTFFLYLSTLCLIWEEEEGKMLFKVTLQLSLWVYCFVVRGKCVF